MIPMHPRTMIVKQAEDAIDKAVSAAVKKHELTFGEIFKILMRIGTWWATLMIRQERHPNDTTGKKGDEA